MRANFSETFTRDDVSQLFVKERERGEDVKLMKLILCNEGIKSK